MKQGQNVPLPVEQQVAILFALNEGYIDDVEIDKVIEWESAFQTYMISNHGDLLAAIVDDGDISDSSKESLNGAISSFKQSGLV